MVDEVILYIIKNGGWVSVVFLVGAIYNLYQQQLAMKFAMMAILRGHIVEIYTHSVLIRKYTTLYEHEVMTGLYSQYKKLKGNGSIDKIYDIFMELPIKQEGE